MLKDLHLPSCYRCSSVTDYSLSTTLYVVLAKTNNKMYKKPHKTVEVQLNSTRKCNYYMNVVFIHYILWGEGKQTKYLHCTCSYITRTLKLRLQ